jgi:hypothetical protein
MKRAYKSEEKSTFVPMPVERMSPQVRAKFDAWVKAKSAERDAKKALDDTASAAARKAKVIGTNEYLCFAMGFGGKPSYTVKDLSASEKQKAATPAGPSF